MWVQGPWVETIQNNVSNARSELHEADEVGAATPRAGSSAASQFQNLEELRSSGSRILALERQTVVQRLTILSPTCVSAPRSSSPGNDPIAEARRLAELGSGSGNPANVTRRPANTSVGSSASSEHDASGRPAGTGRQFDPPRDALESRQGLSRRQGEAGFNLEDTFAASAEEFDILIADAQEFGGLGGLNGHRTAGWKCSHELFGRGRLTRK